MAHVLILSFDGIAAERLQRSLREAGHRVCCCERTHQALRRSRLWRFDLVWMNGSLAGMDELQFLRRLWLRQPHLPVIMIADEEISPRRRLQLKSQGVKMVLMRPPRPHLVAVMTDVCGALERGVLTPPAFV